MPPAGCLTARAGCCIPSGALPSTVVQPGFEEALRLGNAGYSDKLKRHAGQALGAVGGFTDRIADYRRFLKLEEHRVRLAHRFGAGGRTVAQHRADLIDFVLRRVFADRLAAHGVWRANGGAPPP